MQLAQFEARIEAFIKNVDGGAKTIISIKAEDLRILIALAKGNLYQAAKDFPGGKLKIEVGTSPKEPNSIDNVYVNKIL